MHVEIRWCATCATDSLFEQPPCEDGHGEDCLDLACVECGHGIVLRDLGADELVQQSVQAA
ncbi:MAG: hypothetical protein NVSMB55_07350 [Mycobacteriales bacterium]